ncbi:hypothetical protein BCR33DRAFT_738406 [Rhizoclosmatium globosum]|uniref:Uncharacterized protein n=1 Tax=Rhizoclosmatium globosum TaxID=329046 RepID=A0A1Y2C9G3_9FUNG|nr:hypothetical protein BCR33DRAFT_738406 [Rhizoclosmatium globosum]|eukprot:ORY43659.1 hypothetical protein BCR33DRAFT_738406 [Rhizoclosmatium globosum]
MTDWNTALVFKPYSSLALCTSDYQKPVPADIIPPNHVLEKTSNVEATDETSSTTVESTTSASILPAPKPITPQPAINAANSSNAEYIENVKTNIGTTKKQALLLKQHGKVELARQAMARIKIMMEEVEEVEKAIAAGEL